MGLTVNWAVDANHPETLYFKKPGVPLTSELNQDINTTMVYGAVRSDLLDLCTHYTWQDVLGDGTKPNQVDDLKKQLLQRLQDDLLVNGIVVRQVFIGDRVPDKTIQAVLNARNEAQQSAYLKQKAQYEADAAIAKAKGDAQSIAIINDQLSHSKDYLKYLAIQRWDGHLPQYMGGQGDPFVAIGGK